jgi:shikimate kinase
MSAERVALIGFMGAGKSTVGALLAGRLGWDFADTDALVEQRAGAPVASIFAARGEAVFRDLEALVLSGLSSRSRAVIATGGGAPAQERNAGFFAAAATFHLRVTLQTALERARAGGPRPLLSQGDDAVRALFLARQGIYEKLGTGVDTEGREPADIAEEIIGLLRNPRESRSPAGSG